MATWTSQNEMFADIKAGNYTEARLHKTALSAGAVGRSQELFTSAGVPQAGTFSGAAGSWNACSAATIGAMNFGTQGAISPETRHALHAYGNIHSVGAPVDLEIWDLLGYHPSCVVTGAPTALSAPTLPLRATGKRDIQALIGVQTALGAATPGLTLTYQDQDGNASQAAPYAMSSPANSAPIGTMFGHTLGGNMRTPGKRGTVTTAQVLTKSNWLNRFADPAWNQSQSLPPGTRMQHSNYTAMEPGGFASLRTVVTPSCSATMPMKGTALVHAADTIVTPTADAHMVAIKKLQGSTSVTPTASGEIKGSAMIRGGTNTMTGASEQSITQAILGAFTVDYNAPGTVGGQLHNLLTLAKFLGLK